LSNSRQPSYGCVISESDAEKIPLPNLYHVAFRLFSVLACADCRAAELTLLCGLLYSTVINELMSVNYEP
jgi:hypothetical protein